MSTAPISQLNPEIGAGPATGVQAKTDAARHRSGPHGAQIESALPPYLSLDDVEHNFIIIQSAWWPVGITPLATPRSGDASEP
jgi:hypothetical protein